MFAIPVYIRRILFLLYLLVIAWASLSPPDEIPRLISFPYFDKIAHFMMYLIFCILGIWSLDKRNEKPSANSQQIRDTAVNPTSVEVNKPDGVLNEARLESSNTIMVNHGNGWIYFITFLFAIVWGLVMELFQRTMHLGREYSMADLAANITGALFGAGLYFILFYRKRS